MKKYLLVLCLLLAISGYFYFQSCSNNNPVTSSSPCGTNCCEGNWLDLGNGKHIVNDMWGIDTPHMKVSDFQQCIFKNTTDFGWSWRWTNPIGSNFIKSYPEILFGQNPWAGKNTSTTSNLPIQLNNIDSLSIQYSLSLNNTNSNDVFDITFDSWITNSLNPDQTNIQDEVMVFEYSQNMNPYGSIIMPNIIVDGSPYDLWWVQQNSNGVNWNCYSFNPKFSVNLNNRKILLKDFLIYLVGINKIGINNFLSNVTIGSEINVGTGKIDFSSYLINLSNINVLPAQGLVAYYPFNGNANDESGHGNNGTVIGATLTTDRFAHSNSAYFFNNPDYSFNQSNTNLIDCGHGNSLQLTNAVSISIWFNSSTSTVLGRYLIGKCPFSNQGQGYEYLTCFEYTYNGIESAIGGTNYDVIGNSFNPTPNTWYHVVATWSYQGNFILYLNGAVIASKSTTGGPISPTVQDVVLGCIRPSGEPSIRYWYGKLDDIRIYNRVLTSTEVQQLYHEGGW